MNPMPHLWSFLLALIVAFDARAGAANEPPVITAPATQTLAEEASIVVPVGVADPDADESRLRATVQVPPGTVRLRVTPTPAAVVSGNDSAALSIEGERADLDVTLRSLTVTGLTDFNTTPGTGADAPVALTIVVDDGQPGGVDTEVVAITVTPVNDAPTSPATFAFTALEDLTATLVLVTQPGIADARDTGAPAAPGGAAIVPLSRLEFPVQPTRGTLVASATTGTVVYQGAPNANGADAFTLSFCDRGTPLGTSLCAQSSATVTVQAVNDAPSFSASDPPPTLATRDARSIAGWAQFAPGGGSDEASQRATYVVIAIENPALFAVAPAVSSNGTLSYTPSGIPGTSSFVVAVRDDGGTANGGVDTSAPRTFALAIGAIASVPSPVPSSSGLVPLLLLGFGLLVSALLAARVARGG